MSAPALVVGDWNLALGSLEEIAEKTDSRVMVGRGVDHAIVKGAKILGAHRLGRHGSDHDAILFTILLDDGPRVRVLWWNVYVGQEPADVLRTVATLADQHQPNLIGVCEAYRCRKVLAQVPGYRRLQGRPGRGNESERADVALLVRRDANVRHPRDFLMRMRKPWIGPKYGRRKGPRRYVKARVDLPGGFTLRVLLVHLPTGGYTGRNRAAVIESVDRVTTWLGRGAR